MRWPFIVLRFASESDLEAERKMLIYPLKVLLYFGVETKKELATLTDLCRRK